MRDVEVSALNQLRHLAVEERQQKRADMRAVDIGVRHQDNLVVTELRNIKFIPANAGAERHDKVADFLRTEHPVEPCPLHVQDLAT